MTVHVDRVFAPLDRDHNLERIAGGNETEVYRTDDQRYVVKLKSDLGGSTLNALITAREMRRHADLYASCLGPEHSIDSHYLIAEDDREHAQVLVVQPFLAGAEPLYHVDYERLSDDERQRIAFQLHQIIRRSLEFYRNTGAMPDLYGRTSSSPAERAHLNTPKMLPRRIWSFLVERNLLRANNLLLTPAPERRIALVDYDFVRRSTLYKRVYYTVRLALFVRDLILIEIMRRGGKVPRGR
ncbi:MAG: hypothetical protein OHK0022_45380 [Roseiflexaceae bacterium]